MLIVGFVLYLAYRASTVLPRRLIDFSAAHLLVMLASLVLCIEQGMGRDVPRNVVKATNKKEDVLDLAATVYVISSSCSLDIPC